MILLTASKFVLFLGASVAGSIILKNGSLLDFAGDTYKGFYHFGFHNIYGGRDGTVLMKHLTTESDSPKESKIDPVLLAQVTKLRQDLNRIAVERSQQVTIVTGGSSKGSFITVAVPALVLGVSGYGYLRWKGFAFSDFMYVTRRSMSNAVNSVAKQMEQVSSSLSSTKRHLTQRLEHLTSNLDHSIEMQEKLKDEVKEVRVEVARVGNDIETVRGLVEGMRVKIDSLQDKQELGNIGVEYLCEFVQRLNGAQQMEASPAERRPHLDQASNSFRLPGLMGLGCISETPKLMDSSSQPVDSIRQTQSDVATASGTPSPLLQRSFSTSLTAGLARSTFLPRT